ncbi:DNA-binding protein [Micromonospora rubida]|uniref:DNA-binding protein n=1 Tax=Micromonospora rubida TaxID=2697657 RepID=UPI0013778071|nr:DNA-binding protein [Micromonospora rubida]NBE84180.1 DNA-binding protein [Micromonospora rubida]
MTGMTTTSGEHSAASLLAAGAVLPTDTAGAGDRAVPLTARTYRHPALDDRPVVRLVDAALGEGEDIAVGFLGLTPAAEPAVVGLGPRRPLAFPEWVLVHHPADGRHALAVVPELQKLAKQVRSRPKAALDGHQSVADRFARTLPHFLPTFFEQAARVFLAAGQDAYATQLFNKARKAEAQHGLPVDLSRLDEVYVEFAAAKVVSATALAGYAKELSAQLPADEALERFCRLALRAAAAGVVPSTQSAIAVNRLVRTATKAAASKTATTRAGASKTAAGKAGASKGGAVAVADREAAYLAAMVRLPVAAEAPAGWWKAHLPAVTALAGRDPAVRGNLLDLMPTERDNLVGWLTLLADTGALAGLSDPDVPAPARPRDGSAGWLRRFVRRAQLDRYRGPRELYPLVERMAARLRAELADSGEPLAATGDLDLLDLLLTLDVPVALPKEHDTLNLGQWTNLQGERELLALAGDERFIGALRRGLDQLDGRPDALRRLVGTPGVRPLLDEWLRARIRDRFTTGLPYLPESVKWLGDLPVEALRLVSDDLDGPGEPGAGGELRQALDVDLAEHVARSLRGGLFDELGWPDWEQAWQEVTGGDHKVEVTQQEAWPYVIMGGPTTVRVLGAEGIVLRHDLRIPAGDLWRHPGYHYVDGQLLVFWRSRAFNYDACGYWHSSPGEPQAINGYLHNGRQRPNKITLPLAGGGRTTGDGVLHAGDTAVPEELRVITDGTSHWVYRQGGENGDHGWREYDPASNTYGRRSLPRFLADLPVSGSSLQESASWLRPALSDRATPAAAPVDGLLGWRVVTLPDGSVRGEDLAGRSVTVAPGQQPIAALVLPGDDRPRALLKDLALVDPDGVVSASARTSPSRAGSSGAAPLPMREFLGNMLPRDPAGSTALRRVARETAATLFEAALDERRAALAEAAARAAAPAATRSGLTVATQAITGLPVGVPASMVGNPGGTSGVGASAARATADQDDKDALVELVRSTMPAISHDVVLAGVAGVLRLAARARTDLEAVAERVTRSLSAPRAAAPAATASGPTDEQLALALDGLRGSTHGTNSTHAFTQFQALAAQRSAIGGSEPAVRLHLDGPALPAALDWESLLGGVAAVAYRAVAAVTPDEHRETLRALLTALDRLDLSAAAEPARWRRSTLHLLDEDLNNSDGTRRHPRPGILPLPDGAFIAVFHFSGTRTGYSLDALHHDPAGVFAVPEPYEVRSSAPVGDERPAGWLAGFRTEWAARGALPWQPEAAERFAELTGVTPTAAKLVLAGLPYADSASTVPPELRKALGVKQVGEVKLAFGMLSEADTKLRRAVVSALLPEDPARLWTDGPDVAAAAAVWNAAVGRRVAVPEQLLAEAVRAVRTDWGPAKALPALLDPARSAELSTDLAFEIKGDRARPTDGQATGFTGEVLGSAVALAAWVAHHTPAGEPCRAALPAALAAVRGRLANPGLLLDLNQYVSLPEFRQVAGTPSETGPGWERYGAIVLSTYDSQPSPALRPDLLDADGTDPYLPALRADAAKPYPMEVALRLARDPRFAALLNDPGEPGGGARAADGTWWPQDPTRSVPDLVAEASGEHGLGADAAAVYLMLLAMPDPTDRNAAKWTGWKPARLKVARAELAGTDLVVEASRSRAGRSLFLPGPWLERGRGQAPIEGWKTALFDLAPDGTAGLGVTVPFEPAADLYQRAWQRLRDGDRPRFDNLPTRGTRR